MSDHKIVTVRKFSEDLKRTERYTTKISFKIFQPDPFQAAIRAMLELEACLATTCPTNAATILKSGITKILDIMAPVRTLQNRRNYVPFLSVETEALQSAARTAQEKAAGSGRPEDWREYRALRNQKNRSVKHDEVEWQKRKLSIQNNPSDMWKTAKSMLGWCSGGPPTQLYHLGVYVSSPSGLATTMNTFFLEKVR